MSWLTQYYLVIGKNWKQKKTSKCGICVELLFPIIAILILQGFMGISFLITIMELKLIKYNYFRVNVA